MSESVQILCQIIENAKDGNEGAVDLLRDICVSAAKAAPTYDLIAIGRCLVYLGIEATQNQLRRN